MIRLPRPNCPAPPGKKQDGEPCWNRTSDPQLKRAKVATATFSERESYAIRSASWVTWAPAILSSDFCFGADAPAC